MNSKMYGAMVKNKSTAIKKMTLIPVICTTNYPNLSIFCDLMCREENYRLANYTSRKNFIQKSDLKILVSYSPSFQCFFPETNVTPEECFTHSRYYDLVKNQKFDALPIGIVSEDMYSTTNAIYLAMLPATNSPLPPNSRWMTPDEIMEKVKSGNWHHSQEKAIKFLVNALLNLPEITTLHNTRKRISW